MYKCTKHKTHKAKKIAKRVGECRCSGTDYKTKVARAGKKIGRIKGNKGLERIVACHVVSHLSVRPPVTLVDLDCDHIH